MERNKLIKEIIKLQKSKPTVFIRVAKAEDLAKCTMSELNMVYNVSLNIQPRDEKGGN